LPGAAVLLLSILFLPAVANAADECGSLDRLIIAARLVRTVYPELKGKEASITFSQGTGGPDSGPSDARILSITIDRPLLRNPKEADESDRRATNAPEKSGDLELPLHLSVDFFVWRPSGHDIVCRPVHFLNNSTSKMLEAAEAAINAHPEWGDAEALAAARQHGLRFGPHEKAALLKLLPLKGLSPFFGTLRVKQADFTVTSEHEKQASYRFAALRWDITAEEVGSLRTLNIVVEPFGARIVGLAETDKRELHK
jgi:hypothetical protein